MTRVIKAITGQDAELLYTSGMTAADIGAKIAASVAASNQVGIDTLNVFEGAGDRFPLPDGYQLASNHAYIVIETLDTDGDEIIDTIVLGNPWDFARDDKPDYNVRVPVELLDKVVGALTIWAPAQDDRN